jgi:hypothetical protein
MAIDPFTAIGLAGNIVQFLDFSGTLISKGTEIYRSAHGSSTTNLELELVYNDLFNLSKTLASTPTTMSQVGKSQSDKIALIASSCQSVAQELLNIVQDLKLDPNSKHRKWKSFRQALKSVWKQSKIDDLEGRLDRLRKQLSLHLATIVG